ncbi:heavy-metal-associated domain-containing protein [Agromyces binzhouensis]|uniref:Heavy-metal-associated domain-containing protein n=1 Tax=Agromyces binzhouensis TaxID=1817495 RepID=A0A4V1QT06_9MICO|nr:heavy-metal-associated domain-containing protein [Agromyces binzhouensis]RXZ50223.1 heavy-metal-associated domain-containing protein [Agromyces binzhouensis]
MSRSGGELSPALRLGLFGVGLAGVFGLAVAVGPVVVPSDTVTAWAQRAEHDGPHGSVGDEASESHSHPSPDEVPGLSLDADGYRLDGLHAPGETGDPGELGFRILDVHDDPVTDFDLTHERPLHLIVVRSDGAQFRHVHPELGADGVWSIPWDWDAAGGYRLFADFRPAGHDRTLTLTTTTTVNGVLSATDAPTPGERVVQAGPYTVELSGDPVAGTEAELEFTVRQDGRPVTAIEPYLGAAGHLVMLRVGDLGYLHAHPLDEADTVGTTDLGPVIRFAATPPTAGDYLVYVDFRVAGQVHTAAFTVVATPGEAEAEPHAESGDHAAGH